MSPGGTTEYAGNYVYEGSSLKFFNHPEGYVDASGSGYEYVYQYKDHLGNVRLSYSDSNNSGSVTSSEILEENNYYPFGLKHKGYNNNPTSSNIALKYKYNGKELEEGLGLNWYNYGARRYDAALGRWLSSDPLAEKYETVSPYTYVLNNPINAIDPDGRLVIFVNGLLFTPALGHKTTGFTGGEFVGHYAYPPPRNYFRNQEPTMFGQQVNYWGNIDNTIAKFYGDDINTQSLYYNATSDFTSQAKDRFKEGQASGLELVESIKNGTIELENGETIKIVGHSQGAAFAAGMVDALMNSEYASLVEAGIYLAPHQPDGFEHNEGVFGAQFSTRSDQVSSNGKGSGVKGTLMQLFNGKSKYKKIKGVNFLYIRPSHDEEHKGHGVGTWQEMLDLINNFLNDDNEED